VGEPPCACGPGEWLFFWSSTGVVEHITGMTRCWESTPTSNVKIVIEVGLCFFLPIITDCLEHSEKEEKGRFECGEGSEVGMIYIKWFTEWSKY